MQQHCGHLKPSAAPYQFPWRHLLSQLPAGHPRADHGAAAHCCLAQRAGQPAVRVQCCAASSLAIGITANLLDLRYSVIAMRQAGATTNISAASTTAAAAAVSCVRIEIVQHQRGIELNLHIGEHCVQLLRNPF